MSITKTVVRDRMVSRLKELELSTHEALAYVTLLEGSNMTAGKLCKQTGIPDSKIYHALDALASKGMLTVQRGTPNVYSPVSPKEAIANLKRELTEKLDEKMREADVLVDMLTPIYDSAEKPEELEIAYIIRGQKNIINRMKALVETAHHEITIFAMHPAVMEGLRESLIDAKEKRKVKLNVAMTEDVLKESDYSELGEVRLLYCSVGMIISDMKTLLTLSDWVEETASLTQDQNLIRVARDYYDNPRCCKNVR